MQIGVGAVDDDANVWKKSHAIRRSKIKIVVGNRPSGRPKPGLLHKVHVIACMQLHQSVHTCGHAYVGAHARLERKRTPNERRVMFGQCFRAFSSGKS